MALFDKKCYEIAEVVALATLVNIAIASITDCTLAQSSIEPDNTLGSESSIIKQQNIQGIKSDRIEGGATRGANLFHSFREFNVSEGRGAYFVNPTGVENIFSRVTGNNISQILGKLGVLGNANLFLLNPNGIIFGKNASLDLRGSFVATTANAIEFGDRGFFSASDPQSPSNLLTINPSAFFFDRIQTGQIKNQSIAQLDNGLFGLQVPNGQSLLLVGGEIVIDEGVLNALGGRIELAGVEGDGKVELDFNGNQLSLSFPKDVVRTDVSIINGCLLRVDANDGGNIIINARNLEILEESFLVAGIGLGLGSPSSQSGNITLNSTENIKIEQSSRIINNVFPNSIGNGGDIRITTRSLSLLEGAQLQTITFGQGNTGSVIIDATDTVSFNGSLTGAISLVLETAKGQGGDVRITTGSLYLYNGAQLQASTLGWGNAGSVVIDARDNISFDGGDNSGFVSGIFTDVNETGIGQGGDISIRTSLLSLTNGAEMTSSTYGKGNAGNIIIEARDTVFISGLKITNENILPSGIFSNVQIDSEGNGGNIQISTGSLFLSDNAELDVGTFEKGNGGSVIINARDLVSLDRGNIFSNVEKKASGQAGDINISVSAGSILLINRAEIQASTAGQGNAGNVSLTARDTISFDGVGTSPFQKGLFPTGIFSEVEKSGKGKGGDIRVSSDSVSLTNGAQIVASTGGQGEAGTIAVEAQDLVFIDGIGINQLPSGMFTSVRKTGKGKGGDIRVSSDSVSLTNGALLDALTLGQGNAGNLIIDSHNEVFIGGVGKNGISSGLFTSTENGANGQGGAITVQTNSFHIEKAAVVNAQTSNANRGGDVTINANTFEATDGAQIITTTRSSGQAGNITIDANDSVIISGDDPNFTRRLARFGDDIVTNQSAASGLFANTTSDSTGNGGNISIDAKTGIIQDNAEIAVDSQGTGIGGTIAIDADSIALDNNALISAETASNTGGDLNLQVADLLLLRNASNISTTAGTAGAGGDGGNVTIDAKFIAAFADSNITANAFEGNGGNVNITTQGIFGIEFRDRETSLSDITASSEFGTQGQVTIAQPDVDPSKGLVELPTNLTDASEQIIRECPSQGRITAEDLGSFTIVGRGGLPPNPSDPHSSETTLSNWATLPNDTEQKTVSIEVKTQQPTQPLVEAQGWQISPDGKIVLVGQSKSTVSVYPNGCL